MINYHQHRRYILNQCLLSIFIFIVVFLVVSIAFLFFFIQKEKQHVKKADINFLDGRSRRIQKLFNKIYGNISQWNLTLCSHASHHRGPHQKVIAISVYGKESKFTNNQMYSWETSIIPFFELLVNEINTLLPQWILRLYIDFSGSKKSQQEYFYNFSSVDICDMTNIPMFGSSLHKFLPGKMWRFLPIFDPYVDYLLSRDLDSPITQRETETINMWLSQEQENNFFYIARDNSEHGLFILGGLWGAALIRARKMWRFLPIFDPYVDYLLSRDLDSPITQRETETINMWLAQEQENNFFYIARDNIEHGLFILGGLWGAALIRARHTLVNIFKPMLIPSIVKNYHDRGDQRFLINYVAGHVKDNSLIFDSYFCEKFGGQPFLSQRSMNGCYLGCIRPCCSNATNVKFHGTQMPCPIKCRPKEHLDWIYC
ncbi:unnamed protein product [Rotaria sp. Silwood1]|nr:unnamed protein product [Rotaria sp. Silwood1]